MVSKIVRSLVIAITIFTVHSGWSADSPTVHDVYEAAQAGKLGQAQHLIEQVLAQHPKSSKAHYVAAEIYAKEGNARLARSELVSAEQLEPGLPYAKPASVAELKQSLGYGASTGASSTGTVAGHYTAGFPWGMIMLLIGAIVVIGLIVKTFMNRSSVQMVPSYPGAASTASSYQAPGYSAMQTSASNGSGILGSLATGAALGAGMVAGEALVHHLIDGNRDSPEMIPSAHASELTDNLGGEDFGINDSTSWDDASDFSDMSGGNDWS